MKQAQYDILMPEEGAASIDRAKPNYNAFISGLLSSPSTTKEDRERIVDLLLKERDKGFVTEEQVIQMIKKYSKKDSPVTNEKKAIPEPKQTCEFLSLFGKNDNGLKNLTHGFNYGFIEYDQFINQCRIEFEDGLKKYPNVQGRLLSRIKNFAFESSPQWYVRKGNNKEVIELGWSEPTFVEWYKTIKKHPWDDPFYKKHMIDPFKDSIQVRADTGNLLKMIESLKTMVFGDPACCNVFINENVKSAQFYTNVDDLGQAIFQIFSTIKDYSERTFYDKIEIDYIIDDKFKTLTITHIDSRPTKMAHDKTYVGGHTDSIIKSLMGLCNYEIHAVFPDGAFRKVLLSDNSKEYSTGLFSIDEGVVKGYTHMLKFY